MIRATAALNEIAADIIHVFSTVLLVLKLRTGHNYRIDAIICSSFTRSKTVGRNANKNPFQNKSAIVQFYMMIYNAVVGGWLVVFTFLCLSSNHLSFRLLGDLRACWDSLENAEVQS